MDIYTFNLWKIVKKGFLPIIVISIIFGGGLAVQYEHIIKKNYVAISQLLIVPNDVISQQYGGPFDLKYIDTYKGLISGKYILQKVNENLGSENELSVSDLQKMLVVQISDKSQIISLSITSKNSKKSQELVNLISRISSEEIPKKLTNNKLEVISKANSGELVSSFSKRTFYILSIFGFILVLYTLYLFVYIFSSRVIFASQLEDILGTSDIFIFRK